MADDGREEAEAPEQTRHSNDPALAEYERRVEHWKNEAQDNRRRYDQRWAKNIQLLRGIFPPNELSRSKVRKRSKIFFRKIWSTDQRVVSAMYYAFLREKDQFRIVARSGDPQEDVKATVLQAMVEYRRDVMFRTQQLFIKFVWSIMNMIDLGWTCGLLRWVYKDDVDGPEYVMFPNEQVYPDLSADVKSKMRYIIFESYMTEEDLEDEGLTVPDDLGGPGAVPYNIVRAARYINQNDPMQYQDSPQANAYPQAGMGKDVKKEERGSRYRVEMVFHREKGKVMYGVLVNGRVAKPPKVSEYGKEFPAVMGTVLTVAHKLLGEGFPEAMEGPQESLNVSLNQRKDNISLLMNGEYIASRYSNVDLQALGTSRPGNVVLADDPNAVVPMKKADYTQSAYLEAAQDVGMMEDVSGVQNAQNGDMSGSTKATTAQINNANGNAKLDLFIATVAETFFRDFFTQLTQQIQRFETDEKVFKIANAKLHAKHRLTPGTLSPVEDIDDFEADLEMNIGPGTVSQDMEKQQLMMLMDKAMMSNQASAALIKSGMVAPNSGIEIFNPTEMMRIIFPKFGLKDFERFFIKVQPPPQPPPGGVGPGGAATAGANTPQVSISQPPMPTGVPNGPQ